MYEKILKNYVYVCPFCFNKPEECICYSLPFTLIQIDKKILPSIKLLNEKGYFTQGCCAGHLGSSEFIYIIFKDSYKSKSSSPKGFKGSLSEGYLRADITGINENAKKRKQKQLLNSLYNWVCLLDNKNNLILDIMKQH